ncbi:MAG: hypothetical protein P8X96_17025 [Desulfobacteraceae bacterium]
MSRSLYKSNKRQKELDRKKKQELKRQRKIDKKADEAESQLAGSNKEMEPSQYQNE